MRRLFENDHLDHLDHIDHIVDYLDHLVWSVEWDEAIMTSVATTNRTYNQLPDYSASPQTIPLLKINH